MFSVTNCYLADTFRLVQDLLHHDAMFSNTLAQGIENPETGSASVI